MAEDVLYVSDLPVIADRFERNAERSDRLSEAAPSKSERALWEREARTWREAADMLRSMRLTTRAAVSN